ncbi:MAG: peptidyl-prolyl cis-trans isomerase [Pirellulales bacterium]
MARFEFVNNLVQSSMKNRRGLGMAASALAILAVALIARAYWGSPRADAKDPPTGTNAPAATNRTANSRNTGVRPASATEEAQAPPQHAATVNGEHISREQLAAQAMNVFGVEVLQNLVNRQIIVQACQDNKVKITRSEVDLEIDRLAQRFGLSTERYLSMLKEERGVTASQYAMDIIWPMLALRKLTPGGGVNEDEVQKAFEAKYGPAVKARLIAVNSQKKASMVQAKAAANPESFASLAKEYSDDPSASLGGIIQPIHLHLGNEEIEKVAFRLKPGQVSPVLQLGTQFIILKCDKQLPAQEVQLSQVRPQLEAELREGKERQASNDVFKNIQQKSKTKIYFNTPQAGQAAGIAAVVNNRKITNQELGEACIERHGEAVLEDMITRRVLEQAVKRQKVTVSRQDIDEEIARAARSMAATSADGKAMSVDEWLDTVTKQQGVTIETYIHDAVWPSVALKKLVHSEVQVTDEDLKKGYEANYGPRVRCLAIVLNNQRRAQEVWQKARDNDTNEYFGELAEQYSIEESSRLLRGEVPPLQKHGGQPLLEREAFALQPGELSSVITMGDKYIILRCLEFTQPIAVKFSEVQKDIEADIFEKKLRLAMGGRLEQIKELSRIDNYLTGESQAPKKSVDNAVPEKGVQEDRSGRSLNGGPRSTRGTAPATRSK